VNDPHLHLLVDDDEVDACWHVTRVIARPEARTAEPVLKPDRAWEGRAAGLSGTVLRDGPNGAYRLWYRSFHDGRPESDRNFLNYAESSDGLAWKKPALRLIEYEGDRNTNIVYRPSFSDLRSFESNGLVIDEVGAPRRRYKLVAHHGFEDKSRNGLFGLFSPDGMRWTVTDRPLLPGAGDRHGALKDPVTGEYVVFTRSPRYKARARGRDDPDSAPLPYKRIVGRTTSRDFVNWPSACQPRKAFQGIGLSDRQRNRVPRWVPLSGRRYLYPATPSRSAFRVSMIREASRMLIPMRGCGSTSAISAASASDTPTAMHRSSMYSR